MFSVLHSIQGGSGAKLVTCYDLRSYAELGKINQFVVVLRECFIATLIM